MGSNWGLLLAFKELENFRSGSPHVHIQILYLIVQGYTYILLFQVGTLWYCHVFACLPHLSGTWCLFWSHKKCVEITWNHSSSLGRSSPLQAFQLSLVRAMKFLCCSSWASPNLCISLQGGRNIPWIPPMPHIHLTGGSGSPVCITAISQLQVVPEPGWFVRMQVAMTPVTIFFLWPAPRIVDMDFWCLLFNECVGFLACWCSFQD